MKPKQTKFKVEDNVPIPKQRSKGFSDAIRLLKKKGQSIVISSSNVGSLRNLAAMILGTGNYLVRKEGNKARVWRIK